MSETELRDLFGQMIAADEEPPFVATEYIKAGYVAAVRRRSRRFAVASIAAVVAVFAASVATPLLTNQRTKQQTAAAVAQTPQISFTQGVYFRTGATETPRGVGWQVLHILRWHASAPGGICWMSGAVYDQNGAKLTGFTDTRAPFAREMSYRDVVHKSYDAQNPPPYARVTLIDCRGRMSTDSVNIVVIREQESVATFSPGWTTPRCVCWSNGAVRRSTAAGQSATYTAAFNGVAILTNASPGAGSADVYVDGKYARTINANAATTSQRVVGFQTHFEAYGTHTIQIRVTRSSLDIDGFLTSLSPAGFGQ